MLRAQGYLLRFRAGRADEDGTPTALLGAFILAAEPRLMVALRHFSLGATALTAAEVEALYRR